jgi:hypothetical protein
LAWKALSKRKDLRYISGVVVTLDLVEKPEPGASIERGLAGPRLFSYLSRIRCGDH